ncbi:hypothetical protein P154DRAFT_538212 [Amniculicola lignicola CBS 123094]|uniref:Uncharacterized protein n=1 Tax=Amniculicola lignicola CBS 123094 TaxID=1392246 RepID=A0A6A5W570_9PLEO|nr:hypothetical protein P154DRAFT_538212 [Amniculicola lignicola CBS 123094]
MEPLERWTLEVNSQVKNQYGAYCADKSYSQHLVYHYSGALKEEMIQEISHRKYRDKANCAAIEAVFISWLRDSSGLPIDYPDTRADREAKKVVFECDADVIYKGIRLWKEITVQIDASGRLVLCRPRWTSHCKVRGGHEVPFPLNLDLAHRGEVWWCEWTTYDEPRFTFWTDVLKIRGTFGEILIRPRDAEHRRALRSNLLIQYPKDLLRGSTDDRSDPDSMPFRVNRRPQSIVP